MYFLLWPISLGRVRAPFPSLVINLLYCKGEPYWFGRILWQTQTHIYPVTLLWWLAATPLVASICTLNVFEKKKFFMLRSSCDFSWESVGTLPQNRYKPSRNLWEATLLRRIRCTDKMTDRQTSCYFIIGMKGEKGIVSGKRYLAENWADRILYTI